jgi:hypothetical protein
MFDSRSTANHPTHANHYYLPFIAVRPYRVGSGSARRYCATGCPHWTASESPAIWRRAARAAPSSMNGSVSPGWTGPPTCPVAPASIRCGANRPPNACERIWRRNGPAPYPLTGKTISRPGRRGNRCQCSSRRRCTPAGAGRGTGAVACAAPSSCPAAPDPHTHWPCCSSW